MTVEGHHTSLRERLYGVPGVIMLMGASDTGKTTLGMLLVEDALAAGLSAAYVDGDIAAATVGPPTCVGLRVMKDPDDLEAMNEADELRFVGSTTPESALLSHVVAVGSLVDEARRHAEVVVIDTDGVVSGVVGQTLKYHLTELAKPSLVVTMHRGNEMEPVVGMLRRFLSTRIAMAQPHDDLAVLSPVERREQRAAAFASALGPPLQRWRVQPTVFAPTLPEEFDLEKLAGMLVGVQDEQGRCLGLGALETSEGVVRVATRHGEQMRGLRLGSLRIDLDSFDTTQVRLRQLIFGI